MKRFPMRPIVVVSPWTTEQDIFLIENSDMPNESLALNLPFSLDEIIARKKVLGLMRRQRHMIKGFR
ncbi:MULTISPECIES: hypothetical protein [unclassified Acinetobacter]|uniref:hypothetical protein n=1 Tax=unclassified Acinetobacter TaxID=196816 RepID=UPI001D0EBACC|nr:MULTISPECIES: hypothetical protein [unclassified Acinetobacter]